MLACEYFVCHSNVVGDVGLLQCDVVLFVGGSGCSEDTTVLQNVRNYLSSDSSSEDLSASVIVTWKGAKLLHSYACRQTFFIIVAPCSIVSC